MTRFSIHNPAAPNQLAARDEPTTVFENLWDTPLNRRGHIRFNKPRNTVSLVGLATGKVTALSSTYVEGLGGHVIVLHVAGSSYWAGRGDRGYAGATVLTVLVEREPRGLGGGEASYRYVELSRAVETKANADAREAATAKVIERLAADL